jgi:hypothetical protein
MIKASDSVSCVSRSWGTFPDNIGNWSILCRFKYNGTPAAAKIAQVLFLFDGDPDFTGPYIACSSSAAATSDIDFEVFNGTTTVNSANTVITASTQCWFALVYTEATHSLAIYVNGVLVDTLTINLDSVTWSNITGLGFPAVTDGANISIAYLRAWSRTLSLMDLTAEAASITPVSETGLLFTNPFQTGLDLTAHNNTLNHFVASGTVTTDTTDPLLSIVAGPPTNITPTDAVEISYDGAYFQDVNSGGIAVAKTWFKIPATNEGTIIIGGCAFGDLTTYKPSINIYEGLANANANVTYQGFGFSGGSDLNTPFQVPIDSSKDYYYAAARNGAVAASTLQVSVLKSLTLSVPVGSIMVNDDTGGYICAMDVGTGYPIHFFTVELNPFGEGGCPQNDGTIVLCNDDNNLPALYDAQFNLIRELTEITVVGSGSTGSNLANTFAIGTWPLRHVVRLCDNLGVVDPTIYDTGTGDITALGLNVDASKFYYSESTNINVPVKTWNILTNSAGTDLIAAVATELITKGPVIVLQDGKILSPRLTTASPRHFIIKSVDSAGTPIHTYDLGAASSSVINDNRLATDPADPVFFWGWGKENTGSGLSFFNKVKVSDGSLIVNLRNIVQYESGLYNATDTDTNTPVRFGHSESCPFWINRVELFGSNTAFTGLYKLTGTNTNNQRIAHDNDWIDAGAGTQEEAAIPNPFGESYLAGDE